MNFVRKIGAVAASALMVGATFGVAAAVNFSPSMLADNGQAKAQLVVGANAPGRTADTASATTIRNQVRSELSVEGVGGDLSVQYFIDDLSTNDTGIEFSKSDLDSDTLYAIGTDLKYDENGDGDVEDSNDYVIYNRMYVIDPVGSLDLHMAYDLGALDAGTVFKVNGDKYVVTKSGNGERDIGPAIVKSLASVESVSIADAQTVSGDIKLQLVGNTNSGTLYMIDSASTDTMSLTDVEDGDITSEVHTASDVLDAYKVFMDKTDVNQLKLVLAETSQVDTLTNDQTDILGYNKIKIDDNEFASKTNEVFLLSDPMSVAKDTNVDIPDTLYNIKYTLGGVVDLRFSKTVGADSGITMKASSSKYSPFLSQDATLNTGADITADYYVQDLDNGIVVPGGYLSVAYDHGDGDGVSEIASDGLIHMSTTDEVAADGWADEGRIVIKMPDGFTLGDLKTVEWDVNTTVGYPPHLDVILVDDIDSIDNIDSLTAEMANKYGEAMSLILGDEYPETSYNTWLRTFEVGPDEGEAVIDDTTIFWVTRHGGGVSDAPVAMLANMKAGTLDYPDVGEPGDPVILIDSDTVIDRLEIEIDNWGWYQGIPVSDAYLKNLRINGELYNLPPFTTLDTGDVFTDNTKFGWAENSVNPTDNKIYDVTMKYDENGDGDLEDANDYILYNGIYVRGSVGDLEFAPTYTLPASTEGSVVKINGDNYLITKKISGEMDIAPAITKTLPVIGEVSFVNAQTVSEDIKLQVVGSNASVATLYLSDSSNRDAVGYDMADKDMPYDMTSDIHSASDVLDAYKVFVTASSENTISLALAETSQVSTLVNDQADILGYDKIKVDDSDFATTAEVLMGPTYTVSKDSSMDIPDTLFNLKYSLSGEMDLRRVKSTTFSSGDTLKASSAKYDDFLKEDIVVSASTGGRVVPSMDIVDETSADQTMNLVLVGGPVANTLVADLVTAGKSTTDWYASEGDIEIINNAFMSGKYAIVVAGKDRAATKEASEDLAGQL